MAKIGEFAIAKFDNGQFDENDRPLGYEEVPCLITGRDSFPPYYQEFIYWRKSKTGKLILNEGSLPKNRLKSIGLDLDYVSDWEVFESIGDAR